MLIGTHLIYTFSYELKTLSIVTLSERFKAVFTNTFMWLHTQELI
jgi:hypothetical protein